MIENKNITFNISTAAIFKVVIILLSLTFLYYVRDILLMIFLAIIFASLIEPAVNFLEGKKIPRKLSIILVYILVFLIAVLIIQMLIPPIYEQIGLLAANFPDFWYQTISKLENVKQYSLSQGVLDNVNQVLVGLQDNLTRAASGVYYFILSVFENFFNFIIILFITYYLAFEPDALGKILRKAAPGKYHPYLSDLSLKINQKIGSWARGQLLLCLIVGTMAFVGLLFILPKYALLLALIVCVTEIIPYVGPIIGAIPAVFLGFMVPPFSIWRGLIVVALYILIQELENNIITPQVMKKQLGLHPVVIIVAMLIGAKVAGIAGVFLAVPVSTVVSIIAKDFAEHSKYFKS
jgi:predicted PurR-regulated permease PerM